MLALSASMSIHNVLCVSLLKKYIPDANHVIDWNMIQVEQENTFHVHTRRILDRKSKHLQNRAIGLVNIKWNWYGHEGATWEHKTLCG
jgi:hypothetical protein